MSLAAVGTPSRASAWCTCSLMGSSEVSGSRGGAGASEVIAASQACSALRSSPRSDRASEFSFALTARRTSARRSAIRRSSASSESLTARSVTGVPPVSLEFQRIPALKSDPLRSNNGTKGVFSAKPIAGPCRPFAECGGPAGPPRPSDRRRCTGQGNGVIRSAGPAHAVRVSAVRIRTAPRHRSGRSSNGRPGEGGGTFRRPPRMSALDLGAVARPQGVERALAVDPVVGVRAEEVALALDQGGRQALGAAARRSRRARRRSPAPGCPARPPSRPPGARRPGAASAPRRSRRRPAGWPARRPPSYASLDPVQEARPG